LVSLPLADGWGGQIGALPYAVVGQEEVTVPAGTFICWRLESPGLAEGRRLWPARAWVAVDRPLVVRYEFGAVPDRRETVLVSFESGSR
jgi:hypothetical protein